MLRFKSLGSSSSGNATLVQAKSGVNTKPTQLLVDCGLKLKDLETRLQEAGVPPDAIDGIFITHEHGDHIGCARHFVKKYATKIWMSRGTWQSISDESWQPFQHLLNLARDGQTFELGDLQVHPFTVPHDAREPLQLRCTDGNHHLGIVTDLGHVSSHVVASLQHCDALLLEANHDITMLQQSAYPSFLKQRVGGPWGHLSNEASAELLSKIKHAKLQRVIAAHLSERNNTPELARASLSQALICSPEEIDVASPTSGTEWINV